MRCLIRVRGSIRTCACVCNRVCVYLVSVSAEVEEAGTCVVVVSVSSLVSQHLGRRRDETPQRTTRHSSVPKRRKGEIGAPERKSTSRRRRREAAVEAEVGEAAVRSDGFVFLHNGGAKRPQTVGLWGVFPSSSRDVLSCKCYVTLFHGGRK